MNLPLIDNGKRWLIRYSILVRLTSMDTNTKREMMTIAKSTGLSIGLVVVLAIGVFLGGKAYGKLETKMQAHEDLKSHAGTIELFVPKNEVKLQFRDVQRQLNDLKEGQKEIIKAIKANK